jgi:CheY-like chemotaxis protein
VPTILYVDDDRDDQELFIEVLKEIEPTYQCVVASDGIEALESLLKINPLPVCIYIDLNMPRLNGWELLKTLASDPAYALIPKFMISTAQFPRNINKARELGAKDFLTKPYSYNEFVKMLKSCFMSHLRTEL